MPAAVSTSLAVADLRLAPRCCRDLLRSYGFCAAWLVGWFVIDVSVECMGVNFRGQGVHQGIDNTSQQDFGTRKVYCVSNVTFHAESKYAIKIFPSPTVFIQWPF